MIRQVNPHKAFILFLLGVLAVGLWACAAPATPSATKEPTIAAALQPRDGGILQFAPQEPPTSFDFCKHGDAFGAIAWVPVYEGLLSLDYKESEDFRKEQRVVPYLAERWEQPNDTTYIFYLRKGVKWHDGKPLTAEDVVFSLEYLRDKENACTKRSLVEGVKSIEKVDANTIKVTTEAPIAPFILNMAQREAVIFPKHIYDAGRLFKSVESQIATGPMKAASFDRTDKLVYTANKDYWKGKPHLDGAVALYGMDRSASLAAFVAKKIDVYPPGDKREFDALKAQAPEAKGEGSPASHGYTMYIRVDKPPFDDVRVRRAIHLAIDRQAMRSTLTQDVGVINPPGVSAVSGWAIPQEELMRLPGYRQPKDQDITEAKRLLAEAGYPTGFTSSIQAVGTFTNARIAEVASRQLEKIGITLKLDFLEQGMYFSNQRKGSFDAQLNGMSAEYIDTSLNQYYYSRSGGNPAHIADPYLDDLIELQRKTFNKEERYKVLRRIQEYLLDKLYGVPTIESAFYWATQPWVHELMNTRSGTVMLYRAGDIWFDERAPKRSLP